MLLPTRCCSARPPLALPLTILFAALPLALTLHLPSLRPARLPAAHAAAAAPSPNTAETLQDLLRAKQEILAAMVPAPNRNYTPMKSRKVDTVVVHYMSGINVDASRWASPQLCQRILRENRVSAHYLVARDGTIYRLVRERDVAWHAGGSIMPGPDNRRNVNRFSIGIETIATEKSGFTDAQYRALAALISDIKSRHSIRYLLGHDQIAGLRAVKLGLRRDMKPDPGPRFDWSRLHSLLDELR